MKKVDFIRIIKEEVSSMDFLNNEKFIERDSEMNLLNSKIFQNGFVSDVLNGFNNIKTNINTSQINIDDVKCDSNDYNELNFEIEYNINYKFKSNVPPLNFTITFIGDNIQYESDCDSDNNVIDIIDWKSIEVILYTNNGDRINLNVIDNNSNIYEYFIKHFIDNNIINQIKSAEN